MRIIVRFYASARQIIGKDELAFDFNDHSKLKISDILNVLNEKYNMKDFLKKCSFSLNYTFCNPSNEIKDGDKIGILPPFGGG